MRFLKQNVDTFAQAGDPGHNSPEQMKCVERRVENTLRFIDLIEPQYRTPSFLDIAGPSIVGKEIAAHHFADYYTTTGDLDRNWKTNCAKVHTVLMLEVLEHILNPLKFFEELRDRVDFEKMIVSWPARPSWLWTEIHYHEMRLDRFEYLCKLAGYEVTYVHKGKMPESWYNRFRGIRPFFRSFVNTHYITLIHKK